jgi:hypothetical protein
MEYSKFALESAVLTLLPEAQAKKESMNFSELFPLVTEKYFLLTDAPDPVDTACYTIVKAAISDIKYHGMINYGKTEFAHEISKQTRLDIMKNHYVLPHNDKSPDNIPPNEPEYVPANDIDEGIPYREYDEMECR